MSWRMAAGGLLILSLGLCAIWGLRPTPESSGHGDSGDPVEQAAQSAVLDDEKQKSIWTAEHITFEIETHFGKPFAAALRDRDMEAPAVFFRDDCRTSLLSGEDFEIKTVGVVSEQRRVRKAASADTHGVVELLETLGDSFNEFGKVADIRLRVLRIETDAPRRWRTSLLLTARGTDHEGAPIEHRSEHDVEFDLPDDEKILMQDIVLNWSVQSETVRRSSQSLMEEATAAYGLDQLGLPDNWQVPPSQVNTYGFQVAVEDFNRDGYLDIAIATAENRPILLRSQEGKRFTDVASQLGLLRWDTLSTLVAWIDYDNDGFPDLLMGDRLYRNVDGERFEDVSVRAGIELAYAPMGCIVADYDCDGKLDLYILYQYDGRNITGNVSWVGDKDAGFMNHLWRNEGNGRFRNTTFDAQAGGGDRFTFAASWLFLDDDPFPDLYVANDFGSNVLLRNTGQGSFVDVTERFAVGDFATSMGVACGDFNNDGNAEIYVANMYSKMGRRIIGQVGPADYPGNIYEQIKGACAGNRLYSRDPGSSQFREIAEQVGVNEVGWAFAPAFVDVDNDGWLDLYATTGFLSFDRRKPDG